MGSGGGVSNANTGVPAFSRKVVQSLKEIVNCSDLEIYAMLVECDMDPNETVSRLLSQDTFHEVKRKRDKKKETKNLAEYWKRSIPNRGARMSSNGSYKTTQGGRNIFNFNDAGSVQGVPTNRRENGTHNHWDGSSSAPGVLGSSPPPNIDSTNTELKKASPMDSNDRVYFSSLPSPSYQSAWVNANSGQRTMADIVKMGRHIHQKNVVLPRSSETQESGSKAPLKDEWPSIEKQDVSYPTYSLLKPLAESKISIDQFNEPQYLDAPHLDDEVSKMKTNLVVCPPDADQVPSASVSIRNFLNDDSRDSLQYEDKTNKSAPHAFGESRGEDVYASIPTGFQKLTIKNDEDHKTLPKGDKPSVIIPNHLQMHTSECSHLMFGSFGLGLGSGQASSDLNDNLENIKEMENSSFRHPGIEFNIEEEEKLRNVVVNEQTSYQTDSAARNYHASSDSETETTQHEPPPQEDHQYKFSSPGDYGFENSQHLNPPSETYPYKQNLDNFPNIMVDKKCYPCSLSNNLLPSGIQDAREPDLHYSHFPTKYNNGTSSSVSGPEISMGEATLPNAGQQVTDLTQHLALNPYSPHHGMPLGHYGNLIIYPFMPPSHNPYMPSTFQQYFHAGNHQFILMQHKTQATTPSHVPPPSDSGFGSGSSSSNNLPLNSISDPNSYEDVLSSQFQDNNHLASSLQQEKENSAVWHQGRQSNLRVVPGSGYYIISSHQNQHPPGFPQQPYQQQHFGGHGYASPYHSQAPMSLDHLHHHQQQNATNASKQPNND